VAEIPESRKRDPGGSERRGQRGTNILLRGPILESNHVSRLTRSRLPGVIRYFRVPMRW
jgi:hypothetical protein